MSNVDYILMWSAIDLVEIASERIMPDHLGKLKGGFYAI
jgi:hypothetical protein